LKFCKGIATYLWNYWILSNQLQNNETGNEFQWTSKFQISSTQRPSGCVLAGKLLRVILAGYLQSMTFRQYHTRKRPRGLVEMTLASIDEGFVELDSQSSRKLG